MKRKKHEKINKKIIEGDYLTPDYPKNFVNNLERLIGLPKTESEGDITIYIPQSKQEEFERIYQDFQNQQDLKTLNSKK